MSFFTVSALATDDICGKDSEVRLYTAYDIMEGRGTVSSYCCDANA